MRTLEKLHKQAFKDVFGYGFENPNNNRDIHNASVFLYRHYTRYVNTHIKWEKQADIKYAKDHKHALIGSNS